MPDALTELEDLNTAICAEAGAGHGHDTPWSALMSYDRIITRRQREVRVAIARARERVMTGDRIGGAYVNGIESALERALVNPRQPRS